MFDPFERPSDTLILPAHESVYRAIRSDITEGRLLPGARLVQRKLAKQLGTSPIPVIDALRRLEGEGLLVITPGVGTHVKRWEPHEIEEIYLIRAALEGAASRLFTQRATAADIVMLDHYNELFEATIRSEDLEASKAADECLHLHIVRGTRSSELPRLVDNSACIMLTISRTMLPEPVRNELRKWKLGPPGVHDALIEAIKSGDPERAEQEGRKHVLASWERLRGALIEAGV